jgi:hypothetical protein
MTELGRWAIGCTALVVALGSASLVLGAVSPAQECEQGKDNLAGTDAACQFKARATNAGKPDLITFGMNTLRSGFARYAPVAAVRTGLRLVSRVSRSAATSRRRCPPPRPRLRAKYTARNHSTSVVHVLESCKA